MLPRHYVSLQLLRLSLLILSVFSSSSYSQTHTPIADTIANKIQSLTKESKSDNVYLQTSKDIYENQEDLWFKAYVLDAQSFIPSHRNKILFVQLIEDKTDKVVFKEKYEIDNGFVDGHLYINDSVQPGSYRLEAYSSMSFYKGSNYFNAIHKLQILKSSNDTRKVENVTPQKDSIISFITFPEGGNLVAGIQNKVAFKALDSKGFPVDVSGKLYANNVPIIDFRSTHAGMGSFMFKPNSNDLYHIELTDYKNKKYPLSQIQTQGVILQLLSNNTDFATFKVEKTLHTSKENIYLRVQSRGIVYSVAMGTLDQILTVQIPLKDIPQGIAEVTLFSSNIEPIAERLFYVNQQKKLNIKVHLDKTEYLKREKVKLKIQVSNQDNQGVIAHLGVSIFDRLYKNNLDSKNILTHYQLSTQLNGRIYDPGYYFNEENTNRFNALDLLLLTQGWRRYNWNESNLKEQNKLFKTVLSDTITGSLRLENQNKKAPDITPKIVMIFTADPLKGQDIITTNSTGMFNINPGHFKMSERAYMYLKPMTAEKPKYIIKIPDDTFRTISLNRKDKTDNYPLFKLQKEQVSDPEKTFTQLHNVQKLDAVVITTKKEKVFRDKYLGTLDSLTKLENNTLDFVCLAGGSARPILNCFMNNHHQGKTRVPVEGEKVTVLLGKNNEVLGVNYPQQEYFGTREIIYEDPNQKLTEQELLKKFNLKMIKGFYGKREFYQAVYDQVTKNDPFPDFRNTLFWKPDVITNEQGEAVIEFYCSDINTLFTGTIEGVSETGLLGTENFKFKVKKNTKI